MTAVRKPRTWLVAMVAVAAGLLAAWSAREHLRERAALLEAQLQVRSVARLVAAHDLPAGARLDANQVAIRDVPADYAASDTLEPGRFGDIDGAVLNQPLRRGDPIIAAHLHRAVDTFSARLEAGRRAVTIPVDELNALSGMLTPGDFIDLYISFEHRSRLLTAPLLQGVRVLATGRQALGDAATERSNTRNNAHNSAHNNERNRYATITLDVAAADAVKLVVARQTGRITAMLRHPDDAATTRVAAHDDLAALLGVARAAAPPAPRPEPARAPLPPQPPVLLPPATPLPIPVIYGDQPLAEVPDLASRLAGRKQGAQ